MSKKSKSERTRDEILDTAWALISREGASVSIGKIAEAAGLTRQSVYVHFGSRDGLLVALVRRTDEREDIWGKFQDALAAPSAAARLERCLGAWFAFVPRIYPVAQDLIRLRSHDKAAATAWQDRMSVLIDFYEERIVDLEKEGNLKERWTVREATDYVWAASSVQAWSLLVHERGWQPDRAAFHITHTVLDAVCASH